ncbi:MAG: hypothetical protein L6455_16655 [Kiritimatiellae bacterium]|nr:hypothetical protein [Kiritimatiellia bacterium]
MDDLRGQAGAGQVGSKAVLQDVRVTPVRGKTSSFGKALEHPEELQA